MTHSFPKRLSSDLAKPREPNRFNGENRGAWYAALAVDTCLAEIAFHMTEFLAHAGDFNAVVEYAEMFCSLSGEFLDLMARPDHRALDEIGRASCRERVCQYV